MIRKMETDQLEKDLIIRRDINVSTRIVERRQQARFQMFHDWWPETFDNKQTHSWPRFVFSALVFPPSIRYKWNANNNYDSIKSNS